MLKKTVKEHASNLRDAVIEGFARDMTWFIEEDQQIRKGKIQKITVKVKN